MAKKKDTKQPKKKPSKQKKDQIIVALENRKKPFILIRPADTLIGADADIQLETNMEQTLTIATLTRVLANYQRPQIQRKPSK